MKEPTDVPTFHVYADECWLLVKDQLSENTRADYDTIKAETVEA